MPRGLLDSFSARSREVARAAERFRAQWGRAPERGELRALKLENRKAKVLVTRTDLQQAWNDTAARFDFTAQQPGQRSIADAGPAVQAPLEDRVEQRLTERTATFEPGELRAVLLEQSVGELSPREALDLLAGDDRRTPRAPPGGRSDDHARRAGARAGDRAPLHRARRPAAAETSARRPARSPAIRSPSGSADASQTSRPTRFRSSPAPSAPRSSSAPPAPARASSSTPPPAPSSTAAIRRWGIAVSGSTAQRLGQDSPALAGHTLTLDALVSRVERGQLAVGEDTTIYFDEAGMADTDRLERLTEVVEHSGSKLVAIGDAAQLPSIGAGGMFARLGNIAPSAELSNIRRTLDPDEQRAWADLRAGRSDRAMAHYLRPRAAAHGGHPR